jgi:hypothetical protein
MVSYVRGDYPACPGNAEITKKVTPGMGELSTGKIF